MRLINADKLIRALKRLAAGAALEGRFEDLGEVSDAIYEVGKQPTAYDLDGVLERLREERILAYDKCDGGASYKAYDKAINIVKGGANNENA